MYEEYWGLTRRPFAAEFDAASYFPTTAHQAALSKLRYLHEVTGGAGAVIGASGLGKTALLELLRSERQPGDGPLVHIAYPQFTAAELLRYLHDRLAQPTIGATSTTSANAATGDALPLDRVLRQLEDRLAQLAEEGRYPLIALDDAHLINDRAGWQGLQLLLNLQQSAAARFTLLILGQQELISQLRRYPTLEERLVIRCLLQPLSLEETERYLEHRLHAVGGDLGVFDPAARQLIHQLTQGNLRRINRLCDFALLIGFAESRTVLTPTEIRAVAEELSPVAAAA